MEKIVVIDDDEGLLHFLSRFFVRKGFAVTACKNAKTALELHKNAIGIALGPKLTRF